MTKIEQYITDLKNSKDWAVYLKQHSNLPGPRGNLELAQAAAYLGTSEFFKACLEWDANRAPENTPDSFLYFCGVLGLGRLITEGHQEHFSRLKTISNDSRWRSREAVAMALQTVGRWDASFLISQLESWIHGSAYEQRAVVAGLCEQDLFKDPVIQSAIFPILETITQTLKSHPDPKSDAFFTLRKALGYGWSVAVAYVPEIGKPYFTQLAKDPHPQVCWVVKENLKKKRLLRLDAEWVNKLTANV